MDYLVRCLFLLFAVILAVSVTTTEAKKITDCLPGPDYCGRPLCNPCRCNDLTKLLLACSPQYGCAKDKLSATERELCCTKKILRLMDNQHPDSYLGTN
ncbi:hypothetical protein LSH36_433g03159 [Paralvinella palmiformis]|uniref:Uncharacterized protein n=1 Tax=Paralvinella palmiformis TaxID=53620 RepID=A0AAD9JB99_9ANNE|nr:hypothetical protein LSH36_433g03159 [Paralvinella palmiformis]